MEEKNIVAIDLGSSKIALTVANVNGNDVYNACSLKNSDLHKTNRSATLNQNGRAEVDEIC